MAPRVIKEQHLREVRDGFKLKEFFRATSQERRQTWFRALDYACASNNLLHNEDPQPDVLVTLLVAALDEDEPLGAHVSDLAESLEWRSDPDNWRTVEKAFASVIVQAYLDDCESGDWVRDTT